MTKGKKNQELQTISIKGKDYVTVDQRIKYFRENFTGFSLITEIVEHLQPDEKAGREDCHITMKAEIRDTEGRVVATGFAHESSGSSYINGTSYIENCETSCWGRALGNFGIGIDSSVCSADELANALMQQRVQAEVKNAPQQPSSPAPEPVKQEKKEQPKPDKTEPEPEKVEATEPEPEPVTEPEDEVIEPREARTPESVSNEPYNWGKPTGEPINDSTIKLILNAFGKFQVTQECLENEAGVPIEQWTANIKSKAHDHLTMLKKGDIQPDFFKTKEDEANEIANG